MISIALFASLTALANPCTDLEHALDGSLESQHRCLTGALHAAAETARDEGLETCLDGALSLRGIPAPLHLDGPRVLPAPPPGEGKVTRDAWGPFPYEYETENFVIKWGSFTGFSQTDVEALAEAFEYGWEHEVEGWGYPAPYGTDTYKFNVYIGDTGGGTPSSYDAAGYYWYDDEYWPMIVVNGGLVSSRTTIATTAVHEFFHAIQGSVGTYEYTGQGAWYYEATAVWAEEQLYPDFDEASVWVFAFAFLPEYQLNFFDYPDTGVITEYHQYGAFVFPRYLSDQHGAGIIKRSWEEGGSGGDPMLTVQSLLAEEGVEIEDAVFDFAARNATWDYPHGDTYRGWINAYGGYGSAWSNRPSGKWSSGSSEWREAPLPPRTLGANYWEVRWRAAEAQLSFEALDDADHWYVALVTRDGSTHTRQPLEVIDGVASGTVTGLDDADEAWVAVAVMDGVSAESATTYGYRLRLDEPPEPEDTGEPQDTHEPLDTGDPNPLDTGSPEEISGCGCAVPAPVPAGLVLVLLAPVVWGRRRSR